MNEHINSIVRWVEDGDVGVVFTSAATPRLINHLRHARKSMVIRNRFDSSHLREMR